MDSTILGLNRVNKGYKFKGIHLRFENMEYEKNPDGTDKLDDQGNPIPVTVTDDKDKEAAKVNAGLVEEIKELRLKLGVTQGLLDAKDEPPEVDPNKVLTDDEKLEALLDDKLKKRDALNAKANKKAAFEKFVAENKEFSSDNDLTGLKRDALEKKFNSFNTESLTKIEEFLPVIGDAKTLLLGNDSQVDTTRDRNPLPNPLKNFKNPAGKKDEVLSPKELKLAETTGRTKEQILKLKAKNPEFLESLLDYIRD